MMHRMALLAGCLAIVFAAGAARADWPQFLGADRTNVAKDEKGLARKWPASGPKVLWKVKLGLGYGGAAIHSGKVYVMDRIGNKQDAVRCLDLATGKELWSHKWNAAGNGGGYPGTRSTPATDGKRVFVTGTQGAIIALDCAKGKVIWQKDLKKAGSRVPRWEVAQSVLLLDGVVYVMPWSRKAAVVALDAETGKTKWACPNKTGRVLEDYQSVVPMKIGEKMTLVVPGHKGGTIGVAADTGREMWAYRGGQWMWQIVSPIVVDDDRVLLTGGYGGGAVMLSLATGRAKELWKSNVIGPWMSQPALYDGNIYCNGDRRMTCIDLEGKTKWQSRGGYGKGNMLIADGIIYVVNDGTGDLAMVEAKPDGFKELGLVRRALTPKKGKCLLWGPPAISGGKLIWRDPEKLVCFDVSE